MSFQFDMEIIDGIMTIHFGNRDCSFIHEPFNRNKEAVDKEAMVGRKEQVTTGVLIAQRKTRDTDRGDTPVPGWAGLLELLTPNPFDRHWPPQGVDKRTDLQLFDRNFTAGSLDQSSAKEAFAGYSSTGSQKRPSSAWNRVIIKWSCVND